MPADRCLCVAVPRLDVDTAVVVFLHVVEAARPTNTGRFLPLILPNASLVLRGSFLEAPPEPPPLGPRPPLLLHPGAERELRAEDVGATLLVADGTWPEARRMMRREPAFVAAERVRLPPGPPSRYRLRHHPDPTRLATLEAVARALGVLHGPETRAAIEDFFERFVEAMLFTRRGPARSAQDLAR